MSVRRTIARNTVFNALGRFWEGVLGIGLTIYIVHKIRFDGYGLWSLVAMFTGYAALTDFGVSSAFTKYIAEYAARDDDTEVSSVVSTGVVFYAVFGIVLVGVGWPAIDLLITSVVWLLTTLHPEQKALYESAKAVGDIRFLFRGALLIFAVTNCIAPFTSLHTGLQRMGITNALSFAASLLKLAFTVLFLETGCGVVGLLYANAAVLAVFAIASLAIAYRIFPKLRLGPRYVRRSTLGTLFGFGWRTQVAKLSNLINFQTDRAVVGLVFSNFALVGLYRAGEELATKMRQIPALVVSALIPAVSDLDARDRNEDLARLYLLSTKYIAAITIPMAAFTVAAAGMVMHAMFGDREGLDVAAWILRILGVGYAVNLLPGPGVSIALGKGRAELPMYAGIISMTGNILLTLAFVYFFGFYGVPAGTTLAMALSTAWFFLAMRRHVDLSLTKLFDTALRWPLLAVSPGFLLCLAGGYMVAGYDGRWPNLAAAAGCATFFGVLYIIVIRWTPFLDAFDVCFLEDTLHLGRIPGFKFLTRRARYV